MFRSLPIAIAATLFANTIAFAHPGHGSANSQSGLVHYLANPEHSIPIVIMIALCAATVALSFLRAKKQSSRR